MAQVEKSIEEKREELLRYVRRRVAFDEAEDIVGETFCAAAKKKHLDAAYAMPLLIGIARKRIAEYYRRRGKQPPLVPLDDRRDASPDELEAEAQPDRDEPPTSRIVAPLERFVYRVPQIRITPQEARFLEISDDFPGGIGRLHELFGHPALFQPGHFERDLTTMSPVARRQAKFRAKRKASRLLLLGALLSGDLEPEAFAEYVLATNQLNDGSLQPILKKAHRLRTDPAFVCAIARYLESLIEAAFRRLHRYATETTHQVSDFVSGYAGLKVATLLNPLLMEEALNSLSKPLDAGDPLVNAAFKRMAGLTGDPEAVAQTRWRWRKAIEEANRWEACYVAMYFSPRSIQKVLLKHLSRGDIDAAEKAIGSHSADVRRAVLQAARENLGEAWYTTNPDWAASNYFRAKLVLKHTEGGCRELSEADWKILKRVGHNACRLTANPSLHKDVWGTLGGDRFRSRHSSVYRTGKRDTIST